MSNFKVRVVDSKNRQIIFEASPSVGENRTASYSNYQLIHMPADMLAYNQTASRSFSVSGQLISRDADEARANAGYLNLARQWVLPNFGAGSTTTKGKEGSTPPILKLYAYNNDNINGVQVVLKSYSFSFPADVDYIHTNTRAEIMTPFPVIATLTLELAELYSAQQISAGAWSINLDPRKLGRAVDVAGTDQDQFEKNNDRALGLSSVATRVGPVLGQQTLLGNVLSGAAKGLITGVFQRGNVLKSILRGGVVGAVNSPQVREVFNQVNAAGNRFIGGITDRISNTVNSLGNGSLTNVQSGQTLSRQGQSAAPSADSFSRAAPPPPAPPVATTSYTPEQQAALSRITIE